MLHRKREHRLGGHYNCPANLLIRRGNRVPRIAGPYNTITVSDAESDRRSAMGYRLTLIDQPADSAIENVREFETWEETQEYLYFVVTRANRAWSALAIERWGPPMVGRWALKGYASEGQISKQIAEAADAEEPEEQFRKRIGRALQRGCAKARKDWGRNAMTRIGESLVPHLARAAAKGCGIRLSAKEVLRLQRSVGTISPSISLVTPSEERCCLCGLGYGECDAGGNVVSFEAVCADCARDSKGRRRNKRQQR